MLLPALNSARERARFISCASNQKQIGTVLRMYADSEAGATGNGAMPCDDATDAKAVSTKSLDLLRTTGQMTDMKMFICPSSTLSAAKEELTAGPTGSLSYAYIPGLVNGTSDSGIMADGRKDDNEPSNNHSYQGNILYFDGHINAAKSTSATTGNNNWLRLANWYVDTTDGIKLAALHAEWLKTVVKGGPKVD